MTTGEKLYNEHVDSMPDPRRWKPWAKLSTYMKAGWEAKAPKPMPAPKPAKPVAEKKAPKKKAAAKKAKGKGK